MTTGRSPGPEGAATADVEAAPPNPFPAPPGSLSNPAALCRFPETEGDKNGLLAHLLALCPTDASQLSREQRALLFRLFPWRQNQSVSALSRTSGDDLLVAIIANAGEDIEQVQNDAAALLVDKPEVAQVLCSIVDMSLTLLTRSRELEKDVVRKGIQPAVEAPTPGCDASKSYGRRMARGEWASAPHHPVDASALASVQNA